MKRLAIALLALALPFLAIAQAAPTPPTAVLSWTGPTTYQDGTPITQPISYNVYQGVSATSLVQVATGVTALTDTITTGLANGTTYFWSITAVVGGVESPKSNVASKTFPPGTPSPVVNLTVK